MRVVTAPDKAPKIGLLEDVAQVFLAGSIEQGTARDWQRELLAAFSPESAITFFNPRREVWDEHWSQDPGNLKLVEQIRWELDHLELADAVFFYFQAGTKSPISLLELGVVLGRGEKPIVVCEPGFWREANVVETCAFFGVDTLVKLEAGISELRDALILYA